MASKGKPPMGEGEIYTKMGTKAAFLKERSIEDCLNCPKPRCNGCSMSEKEDPKWGFSQYREYTERKRTC